MKTNKKEEGVKHPKDGGPLREIDINATEFEANGHKYTIEKSLSADRYYKMQELSIELGYGLNYTMVDRGLAKVYTLLNSIKLAESAITVYNLRKGLKDLGERRRVAQLYCTCFMMREGEDRRYWDENLAQEKIKDWDEEGLEIMGFFALAVNSIEDLKENYYKLIQDISMD